VILERWCFFLFWLGLGVKSYRTDYIPGCAVSHRFSPDSLWERNPDHHHASFTATVSRARQPSRASCGGGRLSASCSSTGAGLQILCGSIGSNNVVLSSLQGIQRWAGVTGNHPVPEPQRVQSTTLRTNSVKFDSNSRGGDIHGIMDIMGMDIMENLVVEIIRKGIRKGIENGCIINTQYVKTGSSNVPISRMDSGLPTLIGEGEAVIP
jgi:hypothetical protein